MKKILCSTRFKCSKPYGSPECEFFEEGFTGDCLWFVRNNYRNCANEAAREAALNNFVESVREANSHDGFMDE